VAPETIVPVPPIKVRMPGSVFRECTCGPFDFQSHDAGATRHHLAHRLASVGAIERLHASGASRLIQDFALFRLGLVADGTGSSVNDLRPVRGSA